MLILYEGYDEKYLKGSVRIVSTITFPLSKLNTTVNSIN